VKQPHLTPRERSILDAYPRHGSYKNIAHELGIAQQTVGNAVASILRKFDAASLGQAVVLYERGRREWREVGL
jgi:DNA-binding NarL/FixJ family response regulator